ncbi:MAG: MarR family transcriptional regulator [Rhodothermales bacterium]
MANHAPLPRHGPRTLSQEEAVRYAQHAARTATAAAVDVCWTQWRSLGASASARQNRAAATTIVDPEALVLLTLQLLHQERRLGDFLGWWASAGAHLLSVQRIGNLASAFPQSTTYTLGTFARLAADAGDRRWRRHLNNPEQHPLAFREGKGRATPALLAPSALMVRLRAGIGVGAKADALTVLLGLHGQRTSIRQVARASGYTEVAIRAAMHEMVQAGFVQATRERPAQYAVDLTAWTSLLFSNPPSAVPHWCHWAEVFALLAAVQPWMEQGLAHRWSSYVWSSRARDLIAHHHPILDLIGLSRLQPDHYHGVAYVPAFVQTVEGLAAWVQQHG